MNQNRLATLALAAAGAALVTACRDAASRAGEGGGPPPMPVEVAAAQSDTVIETIDATGQVEAVQAVELRPE
ncbi:MAG TPA: hypothetical protein VNI61_08100, partial [Gemmatimonadales bacterium]|nr:hypothetical protein [Gemmatimonadales bacterium]